LATIYIYVAVLLKGGKPVQIFVCCTVCAARVSLTYHQVPLILVCVLQLVALVASVLWHTYAKKEGVIRLPDDEEEAAAARGGTRGDGFVAHVGREEE
jgi:hypothetical protein